MSCLENLVAISDPCNGSENSSLSGYDLFYAPELGLSNLAKIADERYVTGRKLVKRMLDMAILEFIGDFTNVLSSNNLLANYSANYVTSADFNIDKVLPAKNKEAGFVIIRNPKILGSTKKIKIREVHILPVNDVSGFEFFILDGNKKTKFKVDLKGGMVNSFKINFIANSSQVKIFSNSNVNLYSSLLTCMVGCNGTIPNDCGYTQTYFDGKITNEKEGYGLAVDFGCECDYTGVLCAMSPNLIGKLLYTKTRILLLNERILGTRLNDLTTYGIEQAKKLKSELMAEYVSDWNAFVKSIPNTMNVKHDSCFLCDKIEWVTNV